MAALQYASGARKDPALLPRAVEVAAESRQPTICLELAERWAAQDPKALDAHSAAAAAAMALYRIDRAVSHYRALVALAPGGTDPGLAAVEKVLIEAREPYAARAVADQLAAAFPSSAAARRLQGFVALRADDPASAVRALQAAIAAGAADDESHALVQALRRARILAGDVDAPLEEARAELEHDDAAGHRLDYAVLLAAAKRDEEARAQLAGLLDQPDAGAEALRLVALIEFQDGDDEAAAQHLERLTATGQHLDDAYFYAGLIAERHADLDRALTQFAHVREGDNALPAMLHAATILRTHGEANESAELLDQLQRDNPSSGPEILAARIDIETQAGDLASAGKWLAAAIADYPDSVELRYSRVTWLEQKGDVDAALRELRAVLRTRPADPAAQNALGYTLADHGRDLPAARRLIEAALKAAPGSAAIRDSLGWVLFRMGHADEALPVLRKAFADDPGGDIGAHLGEVLWQSGHEEEAEKVWAQAGAIDLDNRLLKSTRQRLRQQARKD